MRVFAFYLSRISEDLPTPSFRMRFPDGVPEDNRVEMDTPKGVLQQFEGELSMYEGTDSKGLPAWGPYSWGSWDCEDVIGFRELVEEKPKRALRAVTPHE